MEYAEKGLKMSRGPLPSKILATCLDLNLKLSRVFWMRLVQIFEYSRLDTIIGFPLFQSPKDRDSISHDDDDDDWWFRAYRPVGHFTPVLKRWNLR